MVLLLLLLLLLLLRGDRGGGDFFFLFVFLGRGGDWDASEENIVVWLIGL